MKDYYAFAEIVQKPAKVDVNEAVSLFSRLSPEAQEAIIEMLKDLLKAK